MMCDVCIKLICRLCLELNERVCIGEHLHTVDEWLHFSIVCFGVREYKILMHGGKECVNATK